MLKTNGTYGFYPIVDHIRWVERFLPLGVRTIQLRLKDTAEAERRNQIQAAIQLGREYDAQMIINDYWQDAIEFGATWLHLGQEDLAAADRTAIQQAGIQLGISTHSPDELDIALAAAPDYLALGPVYETTLKKMPWAPQGLERVGIWKSKIPCPLVAIGGITLERGRGVLQAGADSIAVVSDVLQAADPDDRVRGWLELFEDHQHSLQQEAPQR
ncbi:MAG: thiamine phosphate synthase [Myxococcales bacterium]|nr:thiamine phosphate synthase [Myxococcales bacterium]